MDPSYDKNKQSNNKLHDDIEIDNSASEDSDIPQDHHFDELAVERISEIFREIIKINKDALEVYEPIVKDIININCHDVYHIEHTLDGILDFCYDDSMLEIFKELLRHYYKIDPISTASYIHAYKDMWDNSDE